MICTPDSIVVGAGVQSLLHILCPMLRERDSAWFFNPSFRQGRQIFEDYGFRTGDIRAYWEKNEMRTGSFKMDLCGTEKSDVCAKEMKTMPFEQNIRGNEIHGKKCLLFNAFSDDSLGRGHAGGRPDEAFKGCGARGYADY